MVVRCRPGCPTSAVGSDSRQLFSNDDSAVGTDDGGDDGDDGKCDHNGSDDVVEADNT